MYHCGHAGVLIYLKTPDIGVLAVFKIVERSLIVFLMSRMLKY